MKISDISKRLDEIRTEGRFQLNRVSAIGSLNGK